MVLAVSSDPGFRCQIIPELVWPYSRTRLALFPNSFQHRPIGSQKTRFFLGKKQGFLKHGLIPELVWPYSRTPFPYSRTHLAAGRFRSTSSGIRPNEFGNKAMFQKTLFFPKEKPSFLRSNGSMLERVRE